MKGAYGHHIEMMLSTSEDAEHQAFGHSLLATRALLDGDNDLALEHFNKIPSGDYFSILEGRIAVLDYLLNGVDADAVGGHFSPPANQAIFYFKAITPLLVAFDEAELLEQLIVEHELLFITSQHWMEECVKKQTQLAMAWVLAKQGNYKESKATLGVFRNTTFPRDYQGTSQLIIEATEAALQA